MIVKNPTVDELLEAYPNLMVAVRILIEGHLGDGASGYYVLQDWDEYREQDAKRGK